MEGEYEGGENEESVQDQHGVMKYGEQANRLHNRTMDKTQSTSKRYGPTSWDLQPRNVVLYGVHTDNISTDITHPKINKLSELKPNKKKNMK